MKFRKKPVVVEAFQFKGDEEMPGVIYREPGAGPFVITIHGQRAYLAEGDWVITEPDGEHHYPCKAVIFESTYDPA